MIPSALGLGYNVVACAEGANYQRLYSEVTTKVSPIFDRKIKRLSIQKDMLMTVADVREGEPRPYIPKPLLFAKKESKIHGNILRKNQSLNMYKVRISIWSFFS